MKNQTRSMTQLAMSVAAMIAGGSAIFILSQVFVLPSVKYVLMAPYLALVIVLVERLVSMRFSIIIFNLVFAGIMSFITIYMGMAIIVTGLITQLVALAYREKTKAHMMIVGSTYAGATSFSALFFAKVFIGGAAFDLITPLWVALATLISCFFGVLGASVGLQISNRVLLSRRQETHH